MRTIISIALVALLAACGRADMDAPKQPAAPEQPAQSSTSSPDSHTPGPEPLSDVKTPAEIAFSTYSKDLARFIGLEEGEPMESAEQKVMDKLTSVSDGEGNAVFEMDKFQGYIGGQAFIATVDNLPDDSVKAQQIYAIGKITDEGTYTLVDYGMRIKCRRGDNINEWGTELCP